MLSFVESSPAWRPSSDVAFAPRLSRLSLFDDEDDVRIWMRRNELNSAHEIQARLLPSHCPQPQGFHIAARQTPALEVGGDHYNFYMVGSGQLGVVIADVSGKGMGAALVAALFASTFRVQSWGNHDARQVLARVNDFIIHALRPGMFVTCIYGLLDLDTRRFSFARAGHEPVIIRRADGALESHSPDGFALGVLDSAELVSYMTEATVQLHPGDQVLLFSDGLTEAMNAAGEELGMEKILQTVARARRGVDLVQALESAALRHMDKTPPHDDRTIVTIAVKDWA